MKNITLSLVMIAIFILSSCSSIKKSVSFGVASGMGSGAAIGAMVSDNKGKGAVTGLAIGALLGGIASYFIHGGLDDRDKETRKDTLFNLEKHGVFGSPKEIEHYRFPNYDWTEHRGNSAERSSRRDL